MEILKKILKAIGAFFVKIGLLIKKGFFFVLGKIVKFLKPIGLWFARFPKNFVNFWKAFGLEIFNFFKNLPQACKTKDGIVDTLVAIGAIIIWSMPLFVVIYVLTWFLNK